MGQTDEKAREKSAGKPRRVDESYDAPFKGFVNLNLSEEDKREFEGWCELGAFWDVFETHTTDGVNFAVKWTDKEKCFLASATQRRVGSPNAGLVVTTRGKTATKALLRLFFSVMLLSTKERWEAVQTIADDDRW